MTGPFRWMNSHKYNQHNFTARYTVLLIFILSFRRWPFGIWTHLHRLPRIIPIMVDPEQHRPGPLMLFAGHLTSAIQKQEFQKFIFRKEQVSLWLRLCTINCWWISILTSGIFSLSRSFFFQRVCTPQQQEIPIFRWELVLSVSPLRQAQVRVNHPRGHLLSKGILLQRGLLEILPK